MGTKRSRHEKREMSGATTEGSFSTDLVDPAVEASLLMQSSGGGRSRLSNRQEVSGVKLISVHLSRPDRLSSWGFLTCGRSFPLKVGEVMSNVASKLQRGDEIITINGVQPVDYAGAIEAFQCARLHLQLRLRRTLSVDRGGRPQQDTSTGEVCGIGDDQNGGLTYAMPTTGSTSSPYFSIPEANNGSSGTVVPPLSASCDESPSARPGEAVGSSTQRTPSQPLHNTQNVDDSRHGVGLVGSSVVASSVNVPSQPFPVEVEDAWRQILFGKHTPQMVGHGCRNYRDLCDVLPIPVQQAVYDRRSCPFSAADGFTEEFHTAVQYTLTQRALSGNRGAISYVGSPASHEHGNRSPDIASLTEEILSTEASRNGEIQRFRQTGGWAQRSDALVTHHKEMLRIMEGYAAEGERWCRDEVERYRQIEDIANEFLKNYRETVSQSHRAEGGIRSLPFAATHGRSREEAGTTSSRSFQLPPPPPGHPRNYFSSVRRSNG